MFGRDRRLRAAGHGGAPVITVEEKVIV